MVILDLYSIFIFLRRKNLFNKKKIEILNFRYIEFFLLSNSLCLKNYIFNFNVLLIIYLY